MRQALKTSGTITEGLHVMYKEFENFSSLNREILAQYSFASNFETDYSKRHNLLNTQLTEIIHTLMERFHAAEDKFLDNFVAECSYKTK